MRVPVKIHEDEVDGDNGILPGLVLTCPECGKRVEVYGTSDSSARFGAMRLREQCEDDNFYDVSHWR